MEHLVPICYLEGYLLYHNVRTSELKVIDSVVSTAFEDDIFEYKQSTFMKLKSHFGFGNEYFLLYSYILLKNWSYYHRYLRVI